MLIGEGTEIEFGSIEQMVVVFRRYFEAGAYSVNPSGKFAMDPDLYDDTYARVVNTAR